MDDLYWPPAQADPENACRNMLPTAYIVCQCTSVSDRQQWASGFLIVFDSELLSWIVCILREIGSGVLALYEFKISFELKSQCN